MPRPLPALLLVLVPLLASCESNAAKHQRLVGALIAKHKAPLTKRLGQLRAAQKAAESRPPLEAVKPVAGKKDFFVIEKTTALDGSDGVILPGKEGCHTWFAAGRALAIANGYVPPPTGDPKVDEPRPENYAEQAKQMQGYESASYAVVCDEISSERPRDTGTNTFAGGKYSGECRVYELDGARYLGGFPVRAFVSSASARGNESAGAGAMTGLAREIDSSVGHQVAALGKPVASGFGCHWR